MKDPTFAQQFIVMAIEKEIARVEKMSDPKHKGHQKTIKEMKDFLEKTKREFNAVS